MLAMRVTGNVNGPPMPDEKLDMNPNSIPLAREDQTIDYEIRSSVILPHLVGFFLLHELYEDFLKWKVKRKYKRYLKSKS